MEHPIKAVLFDWGETLVVVPNMVTMAEQHMACLERIYGEPAGEGLRCLKDYGVAWPHFREAYLESTKLHIKRSHDTQREHRFEDRFAHALEVAGAASAPKPSELAHIVAPFAKHIVAGAQLIEGAAEIIPALAKRARLGVVSNYPYHPIVSDTLERFGVRRYFATVVSSGDFGWLKPHPEIYRKALAEIGTRPGETLFVGDDLTNDVIGPKSLGLRTAWFTQRPETPAQADHKISHLRQLLDLMTERAA